MREEQLNETLATTLGNAIAQLPRVDQWLSELAALSGDARTERLRDMARIVKGAGGCASVQTANGLPCRRPPKAGYPVCRKHGDRAPQTIAKAERLLAIARMPAIEVILDQIDQAQEEECSACGFPNKTIKYMKHIAAISFKLLAITGFGPRSTIDINAKVTGDQQLDVSLLTDEEFAELGVLIQALDSFKVKVTARLAGNVLRESLAPAPAQLVESLVQARGVDEGGET